MSIFPQPIKERILPREIQGYEPPRHATKGNPDLKEKDVHRVRIKKDNLPPFRIYNSTVLAVYDNYYLELVEVVPEIKTKKETKEAKYRKICFPKADYRYGIDSCDLEGKYEGDDLEN